MCTSSNNNIVTCPVCGQPLSVITQESWRGTTYELATCENADCTIYGTTREPSAFAALTTEELNGLMEAVAAYNARRAEAMGA